MPMLTSGSPAEVCPPSLPFLLHCCTASTNLCFFIFFSNTICIIYLFIFIFCCISASASHPRHQPQRAGRDGRAEAVREVCEVLLRGIRFSGTGGRLPPPRFPLSSPPPKLTLVLIGCRALLRASPKSMLTSSSREERTTWWPSTSSFSTSKPSSTRGVP